MSSNEEAPVKAKESSTVTATTTTSDVPTSLDLCFLMDCTASMGPYIDSATESIRKIVEEIVALEKTDINLALVEYRDHPPQDESFVTRVHDFTDSIKQMKDWLQGCSAQGGGDLPEAVADGLDAALKLNWREKSTKICVLIADAPPHGLDSMHDNFPQGCPAGIDPLVVVKGMAQKGITLYCVGCEPDILSHKDFFAAIAFTTGGQYVALRHAKLLSKVIVGGALEEISLEKLMQDVQLEVEEQREKGVTDEAFLTNYVEDKLKSRGTTTYQMRLNNAELESASDSAKKYSSMSSMTELKSAYAPGPSRYASSSRAMHSMYASSAAPRMMRYEKESGSILVEEPELELRSPSRSTETELEFGDAEQIYSVAEDAIQTTQVERMVRKAMNRKK